MIAPRRDDVQKIIKHLVGGVMNIHWKCALHETIYQRQLYEIGAAMEDFYSGAGMVNLLMEAC